jgi:hypothetical protein
MRGGQHSGDLSAGAHRRAGVVLLVDGGDAHEQQQQRCAHAAPAASTRRRAGAVQHIGQDGRGDSTQWRSCARQARMRNPFTLAPTNAAAPLRAHAHLPQQ